MAFWWPLVVIAFAFAICKLLLMLIPSNVPSIDVDISDVVDDGNQTKENNFIYIPSRRQTDKVQCYEPATMKYLGFFPALKPDEVKERVSLARKAQKVSSRDTGKTMVDASLGEIMTTCEKITWLLSEGEKWLKPEYRSCGRSMLHKTARVEFHPLGVIGAIVSWNYPFQHIFNPMLVAVFSGNSIVIKVITGFAETGEALVSSVDKMIFVGSPGVGKMIMRKAADTLISVTFKLGGKDAFIVCEDVDVQHVAQIAVRGALQSSGQNCAGAERFYVHKDIYTSFTVEVVRIVKSVTVGPPLIGKYDMGAVCMQEHSEKLQSLVNDALNKGAEIVGRGSVGNIGEGAVDQYFPPTVIVNVNHNMKLMQDEGSQKRAREIASQLHCGIPVDFAASYMCQSLPFGGVKDSGFGRFAGIEGLRACCLVKSVVEDRWWPLVKTKISKPIQYPISENGFEFQKSLVEALYGLNVGDRVRALVDVLKMLSEPNASKSSKRKD
ncbi:aldehyde dehydrogenase [Striga asiatica]|uniref:Aldehyde dehydrogenase n=1 Tax=Striga asiatica TaxID=4170 RepID=A0A5A7Q2W5_STRAF|nr:aldehyde dehydrogenase [Striga asiatica]GER57727.1 aldehyde dehydrogenase [Striga asiatica]